jgi:hypothetical protein
MKARSPLTICLPLAVFVAACVLSLPTLVIAVVWMTMGVMTLGYRSFSSFPSTDIREEWRRGYRAAFVWFYHLAWWPWYMRSSIRDIIDQVGAAPRRAKKSRAKEPESSSDRQSKENHE